MQRKEYRSVFDQELHRFCVNEVEKLRPMFFDAMLENMISYLLQYIQWGKRVRPYLVHAFWEALWASSQELKPLCLAVELVHLYALIDDDIMDQGAMRHWIQTYHRYISSLYQTAWYISSTKQLEHIWISQTILIWSLVYTWANRLIAMSTYSCDTKALFYTLLEEVNYWQMIDLHLSHTPPVISPESITTKDRLKSWNYTFLRPISLWVTAAWWTITNAILKLGDTLWVAYQMRDDLLDIIDLNTNKTYFSDLQEGNQTIVLYEALQRLETNDAQKLLSYRWKRIDKETAIHLLTLIEQSWAIDATKEQINALLDSSESILQELSVWKNGLYEGVHEIIEFLRV